MKNRFNLNLAELSIEMKLLLRIMKSATGHLGSANDVHETIDWNHFLQLTRHHRVYPMVYKMVKNIGIEEIPSGIVHKLESIYRKNTLRMLYISGEMEQLSRFLAKNEIQSIFLKGPVLATDLYGDISLRTSSDIDILIPLDKLNNVEKLLFKEGYKKDEYIQTILNDWKWRHHHFTFYHPKKDIKVEIHWRLNPGPAKEPRFDDLWERKRKSKISNFPIYLLGREDLFFFLVTHGARHGWSRLRWLQDIDQLIKQKLDWKKVIYLLGENQSLHIGGQALILVNTLLEARLTEDMQLLTQNRRSKRLAQEAIFYIKQMVNLHTEPLPLEVERYHGRHIFHLMSHRQQITFLLSFLYPYPIDAETMPLPKALHFLYFPLRPFLCAWRRSTKQEFPRRI